MLPQNHRYTDAMLENNPSVLEKRLLGRSDWTDVQKSHSSWRRRLTNHISFLRSNFLDVVNRYFQQELPKQRMNWRLWENYHRFCNTFKVKPIPPKDEKWIAYLALHNLLHIRDTRMLYHNSRGQDERSVVFWFLQTGQLASIRGMPIGRKSVPGHIASLCIRINLSAKKIREPWTRPTTGLITFDPGETISSALIREVAQKMLEILNSKDTPYEPLCNKKKKGLSTAIYRQEMWIFRVDRTFLETKLRAIKDSPYAKKMYSFQQLLKNKGLQTSSEWVKKALSKDIIELVGLKLKASSLKNMRLVSKMFYNSVMKPWLSTKEGRLRFSYVRRLAKEDLNEIYQGYRADFKSEYENR